MAPSGDGRLEVFVPGTADGTSTVALWHLYQIAPAGGWSQWVSHGSAVSADFNWSWPLVGASADGRLELFMSFAGAPYHIWQTATNNGWTPSWTAVGLPPDGGAGQNTMARRADGCLELFTVATQLWHSGQTAPNNGWSSWASLGSPPTGSPAMPAVAASADGRLEVFLNSYGELWHIWQTPGGGWSDWTSHGTPPGTQIYGDHPAAIAANSEGRLELFTLGEDGVLWHLWQTTPNGGWSNWTSHETPPGTNFILGGGPAVAASADGRLELFVPGADQQLWHIWQTSPSGGWSQWYSHGRPPPAADFPNVGVWGTPALALNAQGRLELFAVGTNGSLSQIWQTAPSQGWSDWLTHGKPPGCTIFPQ